MKKDEACVPKGGRVIPHHCPVCDEPTSVILGASGQVVDEGTCRDPQCSRLRQAAHQLLLALKEQGCLNIRASREQFIQAALDSLAAFASSQQVEIDADARKAVALSVFNELDRTPLIYRPSAPWDRAAVHIVARVLLQAEGERE